MPRPVPVANGLEFKNEPILPLGSVVAGAQLEHESGGLPLHQVCVHIFQMMKQRILNVVGDSDVDPLAGIRDAVDPGGCGSVGPNGAGDERPGCELLKGHGDAFGVDLGLGADS